MIRTETVTINGKQYEHVWSDDNRKVCRDGQSWDEVYNPVGTGRVYTEGETIEDSEGEPEEILDILLGGADDQLDDS